MFLILECVVITALASSSWTRMGSIVNLVLGFLILDCEKITAFALKLRAAVTSNQLRNGVAGRA
jgi:hypothetical protein